MKSTITSFAILLFAFFPLSFCFSQNITLNSQADVDAFDATITSISGNLIIETDSTTSTPITNLDNLSDLTSIEGDLKITVNAALVNLNGLQNLLSVGRDLIIGGNAALVNLNGLQNLLSVGRDLRINGNDALTNIDGINSLSTIEEFLEIILNPALLNISGFQNLFSLGGDLIITDNYILANINGFSNLTTVSGGLLLGQNFLLENVNGFANLTSIEGFLLIGDHYILDNLDGFASLTSVGDTNGEQPISGLTISANPSLTDLNGLANLTSIDGDLLILLNSALTDCCAIQNLLSIPGSIGGNISIFGNPSECSSPEEVLFVCEPSSVSELNLSDYSIQPNPGQGIFNVKFEDLKAVKRIARYQITNAVGQLVYNKILSDSFSEAFPIDLTKHTKGIYFYSFFDKNNRILATGKLIKE